LPNLRQFLLICVACKIGRLCSAIDAVQNGAFFYTASSFVLKSVKATMASQISLYINN